MRPIEVSGHHTRSETQAAGCFDQKDSKIAAGAPAAAERLYGSLRPLGFPALVKDLARNAVIQVSQQRRRIGRVAPYEVARPRSEATVWVGILAFKHPAEVDAVVDRIDERIT